VIDRAAGVSVMPIHTRIAMTPSGVVRLWQLLGRQCRISKSSRHRSNSSRNRQPQWNRLGPRRAANNTRKECGRRRAAAPYFANRWDVVAGPGLLTA
jgi:hypothetical protein